MLEQAMLAQEISIPVYFSKYNNDLDDIIEDISNIKSDKPDGILNLDASPKPDSALGEIINSVSANGYQVVVSGVHHTANKQSKIPILQGELFPILKAKNPNLPIDATANNKLPLIILTAHVDTFGLINVSEI